MNFKINLEFCLIPSPYNNELKNLIFVSRPGNNFIDDSLCREEDYGIIKYVLSQFGYQEIDFCTFESSSNSNISPIDVKNKLASMGLKYNKVLEFNIMSELKSFHTDLIHTTSSNDNIYFSTTSDNLIKSKIPNVGEKITLHFYLFLQCNWINEVDCVFELIGELYSKENDNNRNFLQIVKSDFVRLDSNNPNTILLQSTKTYGDLIKELVFLHKFNFKFVKPIMSQNGDMILKTKLFNCDLMEIKKVINPSLKIVVELRMNKQYDEMLSISKKIKKELEIEQRKVISLDAVRPEILILKQKLKAKMLQLAESDEFEKANIIKNDISFVENKIRIIDSLEEKNITREEYLKTFCLNC